MKYKTSNDTKKESSSTETDKDSPTEKESAQSWCEQIKVAREFAEPYIKRGQEAYKAYTRQESGRSFGIHYSNVNTIGPNLFFRVPDPRVVRKNKRKTNPVHIKASDILETNLQRNNAEQPIEARLKLLRTQYLNVGMSTGVVRYEFKADLDGDGKNAISTELATFDIVHFEDFLQSPARYEDEVTWKGRAIYRTKEEVKTEFKGVNADDLEYSLKSWQKNESSTSSTDDKFGKTKIWEIWDKTSGCVYFIQPDYKDMILKKRNIKKQSKSDKLPVFKDFFPFPRPIVDTTAEDSIYPYCDHHFIKDHDSAVNMMSERVRDIIRTGVLVKGMYDKSSSTSLGELLKAGNGTFQAVTFNEIQKGMDGVLAFFPAERFIQVAVSLYDAIEREKQQAYEISGIADIIRGAGDPDETAKAQALKGKYASMRLEEKQRGFQRLVRDVYSLQAEVIAETFNWDTILRNAGESIEAFDFPNKQWQYPTIRADYAKQAKLEEQQLNLIAEQAQQTGQPMPDYPTPTLDLVNESLELIEALKLIREERLRHFEITIETDATLKQDEEEDKASAIEFVNTFMNIIQQATGTAQVMPELLDVFPEIIKYIVQKYDKGRQFEEGIEQALERFIDLAKQPKQQGPDYEQMKLQVEQAKVQVAQSKLQLDSQKMQQEGFFKQTEQQFKQLSAQFEQAKQQFTQQLQVAEYELKADDTARDNHREDQRLMLDGGKLQHTQAKDNEELAIKGQRNETDAILKSGEQDIKMAVHEHQVNKDIMELKTTGVVR